MFRGVEGSAERLLSLCVRYFILNDPTPTGGTPTRHHRGRGLLPKPPATTQHPPSRCHDHQGAHGRERPPLGGGVGKGAPHAPGGSAVRRRKPGEYCLVPLGSKPEITPGGWVAGSRRGVCEGECWKGLRIGVAIGASRCCHKSE